jgi:hypothetical protein
MNKKNLTAILPLILLFTILVKADVPPPAGKVRVKIDLVTETTEDLSDHRFFLDFYGDLKEVEIKSKGRTTIPPMGGGARYSSGTFLAIPKQSLSGFDGNLDYEQLKSLSSLINKKEIKGIVELAKHRFSADVPAGEKPSEMYYLIKREENTLKADRISEEKPKSNTSQPFTLTASRTGFVAGGILITLAVLAAGIYAFRKVSKKV